MSNTLRIRHGGARLGTSAAKVAAAIRHPDAGTGVLIRPDLGSKFCGARKLCGDDHRHLVRCCRVSFPAEISIADPASSGPFNLGPGWKWGYGLLLNATDVPGGRRAGSGSWAGLFNTHFWIDYWYQQFGRS
jgi:hypothetical protein